MSLVSQGAFSLSSFLSVPGRRLRWSSAIPGGSLGPDPARGCGEMLRGAAASCREGLHGAGPGRSHAVGFEVWAPWARGISTPSAAGWAPQPGPSELGCKRPPKRIPRARRGGFGGFVATLHNRCGSRCFPSEGANWRTPWVDANGCERRAQARTPWGHPRAVGFAPELCQGGETEAQSGSESPAEGEGFNASLHR